ncbi:uncharacterized protein [Diadema antillarum]|uniref:uncharacterized protein n=1 Tax=Diadema antillarum TaxID=105358 RepID=UPI003A88297B
MFTCKDNETKSENGAEAEVESTPRQMHSPQSDCVRPSLGRAFGRQRAAAILQQASENLIRERIGFTHCQLRRLKQGIQATEHNLQSTLSEEDWWKVDRFNEFSSEFVFQTTRTRQMRKFKKLIPRNPTTNKPTRESQPEDFIQRIVPGLKHLNRSQADSVRIQITQALTSVITTRPNLTRAEKSGISSLRADNSIHILKADKGNATVVMDKEDYETKIHILLDTDTYKKLP